MQVEAFIARWSAGEGGAERANYALFLIELCDLIGVSHPDTSGGERGRNYAFERPVRPRESAETTTPKRIDLYKRDAFILEAKQSRLPNAKNALPGQPSFLKEETPRGSRTAQRGWDVMMQNARKQAEGYVFLLDADHTAPPFIITCDVGHCFELYADFTGTGRAYTQFPDRNGYRIFLEDLRDQKVRDLLKAIWENPHSLDPAKKAVRVTREIAGYLAQVSKALEERDNDPEAVAHFLMRCLFTMFAEDTGLLPKESFRDLLKKCVEKPETFAHRLKQLWAEMEKGVEFSHVIEARVRHFNGGLFKNTIAFELRREEIGVLLLAAKADWREVDPAIFGTLLEQALDPAERRKLGAHYTPRAYVQRLVEVTVMEPLRADWDSALTKAEQAKDDGKDDDAIAVVRGFHQQLCHTRVLDPACGTGNFLYVSLELMKQLEGEVLETLTKLGDRQGLLTLKNLTVDPHLFLGLELNPRAAAIAELVVWIGYLQWHYRNTETHPEEPILRVFENINFGRHEGYDAVLTWDGYPVPKIVDGKETYPNACRPEWPEAEFIVGNPPFIGGALIRSRTTTGYVDSLWLAHPKMNEGADYVMYWWDRAACILSNQSTNLRRFGFVTTNSIAQPFQRRVVERHLENDKPISILFAIPDHPWTKATPDSAAVRIAMTVAASDTQFGLLMKSIPDQEQNLNTDAPSLAFKSSLGRINADLSIGATPAATKSLTANAAMSHKGMQMNGQGFVLTRQEKDLLIRSDGHGVSKIIRPYLNGRDLTQVSQERYVLDTHGLTERDLRNSAPHAYQRLLETVKPERDAGREPSRKKYWWLHGRTHETQRGAIESLKRYIATTRTAKHRTFTFVGSDTIAESKVVLIASDDAYFLAVLSSSIHCGWALRAGGFLEDRPTYQHADCFGKFSIP